MPEQDNKNWRGERLRHAAKEADLTSDVIGKKMNRAGATIRRYWDGTRKINLEDLKTYAAITNYPLNYFLYQEQQLPENQPLRQKFDRMSVEMEELRKAVEASEGVRHVRATSGNLICVPADANPDQETIDAVDELLTYGVHAVREESQEKRTA